MVWAKSIPWTPILPEPVTHAPATTAWHRAQSEWGQVGRVASCGLNWDGVLTCGVSQSVVAWVGQNLQGKGGSKLQRGGSAQMGSLGHGSRPRKEGDLVNPSFPVPPLLLALLLLSFDGPQHFPCAPRWSMVYHLSPKLPP